MCTRWPNSTGLRRRALCRWFDCTPDGNADATRSATTEIDLLLELAEREYPPDQHAPVEADGCAGIGDPRPMRRPVTSVPLVRRGSGVYGYESAGRRRDQPFDRGTSLNNMPEPPDRPGAIARWRMQNAGRSGGRDACARKRCRPAEFTRPRLHSRDERSYAIQYQSAVAPMCSASRGTRATRRGVSQRCSRSMYR